MEVSLNIGDYSKPFLYHDLKEYTQKLILCHKDLLQYESLGYSYDQREIFALKAGSGTHTILLTAGVHGRESINPFVLLCLVEWYCKTKREWLQSHSLYVIPLLNPDGYMIALRGYNVIRNDTLRLQIKEENIPYYLWKYNANGIDLNRNFPSITWKEKFKDDKAGSQMETTLLMKVINEIPTVGYLDYHSRGNSIYYYRSSMSDLYNHRQLKLAHSLQHITGYELVNPALEIDPMDTGGNTVHYYSETTKNPAFTIETMEEDAVFPFHHQNYLEILEEIKETPMIFSR